MNKRTFKILFIVAVLWIIAMTGVVSAADGTMTGTQEIMTFLVGITPAIGMGIYGAWMFYRRNSQTGEQFTLEKFAPTLMLGLVISLGLYFTGVTTVTAELISTMIGDYAPLGMAGLAALVFGYFDQYIKNHGGTHVITAAVAAAVATPIPPGGGTPLTSSGPTPVPNQPIGEVTIDGIYLHDAFHSPPAYRAAIDTNLVPAVSIWFELTGTKVGVVMLKVAVDDKVLKSWMPDTSFPDGARATNVKGVGDKMPFSFRYPGNQKAKGEHRIKVFAGYATAKEPVFTQSAEFILELKGDIVE